jgi:Type IV pilus assembly protein PilM
MSRLSSAFARRPSVALRAPNPGLGVELSPRRVTVVRVRKERRGFRCAGWGTAPLGEGALSISLLKCTVNRRDEVIAAVRQALAAAGAKPGKACLSLPDLVGRVTLLSLGELPRSRSQAEEMIRFRMKRTLPFRPEDVAVTFMRLTGEPADGSSRDADGVSVLAVTAIRSVLEEHERLLAEAGLRVGLTSLSTLELANLCRFDLQKIASGARRDAALLNCEPESSTLTILRAGEPIFFRCKNHLDGEDDPAVRMRNLRRELTTSLSYYCEKLGGELPLPVLVRNLDPAAEALEAMLVDIGLSEPFPMEPAGIVSFGATPGDSNDGPAALARLAPALGITAGRMR